MGFVGMALAVMVALIEMHLAIMAGIVLFPWGILSYTMFSQRAGDRLDGRGPGAHVHHGMP